MEDRIPSWQIALADEWKNGGWKITKHAWEAFLLLSSSAEVLKTPLASRLQQASPCHPARVGGRSRQLRCVKWLWCVYEMMLRSMFSLSSNFPKRFLKNHGPECITLSCFKVESNIFSFTKANIYISCICECCYLHRLNHMYGVSAYAHKRIRFSIENTSQAGHCWDMNYFWLTKAREYRNWHGHCQQTYIYPSLRFMLLNVLIHLICLVSFCQQKSVITMAHLYVMDEDLHVSSHFQRWR